MRKAQLFRLAVHTGQYPGVSGGQQAVLHHLGHFIRQLEQAQHIGHSRAALAQPGADLLLGIAALVHQGADALRGFDGVQVFTLQVFDQRNFPLADHVNILDDAGQGFQSGFPARAVTAFTGNDHIPAAACGSYQQRLQHALLPDAVCQLADAFRAEGTARLIRVWIQFTHGDLLDAGSPVFGACEQGVKTPSQAMRLLRHNCSLLLNLILFHSSGFHHSQL